MNDNQADSPACEMLLGLYDEMINHTMGNLFALQRIYEMALESETLDRWPVRYRERFVAMFEDAIRLAADDGDRDPSGKTLH